MLNYMKANALRIGNWVTTKHGSQQVSSISNDRCCTVVPSCRLAEIHFNFDQVEPILLTDEWLLKFGFERNDTETHEGHLWISYEKNGIRIDLPFFTFFWNDGDSEVDVLEVHQLQNLYFSLTGQELEYTT